MFLSAVVSATVDFYLCVYVNATCVRWMKLWEVAIQVETWKYQTV